MGMYSSAAIRYGIILPEQYVCDREDDEGFLQPLEDKIAETDLEIATCGDWGWESYENPHVLVVSAFDVDAGEYGAVKLKAANMSFDSTFIDETAKRVCESEGLDWNDAGYLLTWSRG